MTGLSRRKFLKGMALTLGASGLVCCGLGYAASQSQSNNPETVVETPNWMFGKENRMGKQVLVVYATRTGSTPGVAEMVGKTLAGRGYQVAVQPVDADPDPASYQSVVMGSAVNGGKWLPAAMEYAQRYQQVLQEMPVALFCVHILNRGSDEGACKRRAAYLKDVRALIKRSEEGRDEAYFTGMGMNPSNTSPFLMWIMRTTGFIPEGDCRDWNKITAWAETLFV